MQPLSPLVQKEITNPNWELLRRLGWSVANISGSYCVAWRGRDEVVFEWRNDGWYRLDIDVPRLPKDRHLWIEFDGVAMRSRTPGEPTGRIGVRVTAEDGMVQVQVADLPVIARPARSLKFRYPP